MSNSSIHEFDIVLSPNTAVALSPTRRTAREVHINVWSIGAKAGGISARIGDASVTTSNGIMLSAVRNNALPAMTNAPTELILGSTDAAPGILNVMEESAITISVLTATGFLIP